MIGEQIGPYRIVEKLAEGGMGAVFIARHDLMQREAVIKVLLPALSADQEMVRRFLNEARAATQIHHSGIVEIFDMGFLPSGQAYIVMERLRGEPLASRLRQGPLSVSQATALLRQLASALGAAHEAGIVHRDLKPDNLFLARDPSVKDAIVAGGERLKILDFGIAKLARGGGTLATVAGAVFGTPAYMSPEQCTSAGTVDHRADLYAVGCILFEALCGRPPFGHGGIELIAAHMRDLPPDPRTLAPTIPAELAALLLRLLEKDPARRPQSCGEIAAAIDHPVRSSAALAPTIAPSFAASRPSVPPALPLPTPIGVGQQHPAATERTRSYQGLWFVIAAVVAIGGGGVAVLVGGGDEKKPPAASGVAADGSPPAPAPVPVPAPAPTPAPAALPEPIVAAAPTPPVAEAPPPAPVPEAERPAPVAVPPPAKPRKPPTPPREASCDEVSCVIDSYEGACCAKFRKKPAPIADDSLPVSLGRAHISAGLAKVKGRALACHDQHQVEGTVTVKVKVTPEGQVSSVEARGDLAGTPTGACVEAAVKGATFARSQQGGSFSYPFVLN